MRLDQIIHDLFLLMLNLTQLKDKDRIQKVFIEAVNTLWSGLHFRLLSKGETGDGGTIEIATSRHSFGSLCIEGKLDDVPYDLLSLIRNSVRMLAIILENRMQAELVNQQTQQLEAAKREWLSTFDAMSDWVSLIDLKHRVLRSNRAGEKFSGLPIEKLIGRICCELIPGTEGHRPECPMKKMLQTHQRVTEDFYVQEMNRWLKISVDPVMDEDGNLVNAVHIVRDITELKKMEEERLKSMKLESVGILSGGIAHDFNNLLSVITGYVELNITFVM